MRKPLFHHTFFSEMFSFEQRKIFAEYAINNRQTASPEKRKALDRHIQTHVKINGFRDAKLAPKSRLLYEAAQHAQECDVLLVKSLEVWAESQKELREALSGFLTTKTASYENQEGLELTRDKIKELVQEFLVTDNKFQEEEAQAMLFSIFIHCWVQYPAACCVKALYFACGLHSQANPAAAA